MSKSASDPIAVGVGVGGRVSTGRVSPVARTASSEAANGSGQQPDGAATLAGEHVRLVERAVGALLAAATGDALGWPVEPRGNRVGGTRDLEPALHFIPWTRREGGRYAPHERRIPPGTYSDDTQLILAVGRSLLAGAGWWERLTQLELPIWTVYELGGGGAVRRAAQSWAKGMAPWSEEAKPADRRKYFDAGGNGVVMRVAPHAIWGAGERRFDPVAERILADGVTTHGHPRALVGALCAGYAIWRALRWSGHLDYGAFVEQAIEGSGEWGPMPALSGGAKDFADHAVGGLAGDYPAVWEQTVEEMLGLLFSCREAMGRGSLARDNDVLAELGALGPEGGAGTRTAAAALYFASRYVTRPPAGLLAAAFARKSDTDTNACVAGALLGAFAGSDWIRPLVSELQDAPYIAGLASALAEHEPLDDGTTEWQPTLKRRLLAQLESGPTDQILELPVFGDTRIESIEVSDTRANTVTSWWLSTALGQKITTTRVTKRKEGARRAGETESAVELGRRKAGLEMAPDAAEAQLTITPAHEPAPGEGAQPKTGPRVWTAVQVRDLKRSRALYHDLLGLQIRRESPEFVFFQSNLLLEQDPSPGLDYRPLARGGSAQFKSQVLITVLLEREAFDTLHERLSRSSLPLSTILHHSEGDRFRIIDPDGQVIEVRASARG